MNRENCGAPMKRTLDDGEYLCEFCSSTIPTGILEDPIQILDEPCGFTFPLCKVPLASATILGAPACCCRICRGLLIRQEIFVAVVDMLRTQVRGAGITPRPIPPEQLQRRIDCPSCGEMMNTHPYLGPGNFVIDLCTACKNVWLDKGEITAIALSPGRDRKT